MDNLALLLGGICIYWHGVFMAVAIALAIVTSFIFCSLYKKGGKNDLLNCILLSIPIGFVLSRLVYMCCNLEEYESFTDYLNFTRGGYSLYGVIFGVLLSALILKKINPAFNAGAACDCIAAGSALGIVIGRMSSYFSGDNIGLVIKNPAHKVFPFAVYNAQKGDWVIAVFRFEAAFEVLIFIVLCVLFAKYSNEKKNMSSRHGDIALLFLLMHGCSQGIFDSMHVDALYFMNNSFVRMQQIFGAICFTIVTVIFAIRSKKINGLTWYVIASPIIAVAAVGITLAMELNRISYHNFIRNYSVIFACMFGEAINGILIYRTTLNSSKRLNG